MNFRFTAESGASSLCFACRSCSALLDAEQLPDEIFQMRGDGDDQLRSLLQRQCVRILPRRHELGMQLRRRLLELRQENAIQTSQSVPIVQILEREPKRQRKGAMSGHNEQAAQEAEAGALFLV